MRKQSKCQIRITDRIVVEETKGMAKKMRKPKKIHGTKIELAPHGILEKVKKTKEKNTRNEIERNINAVILTMWLFEERIVE